MNSHKRSRIYVFAGVNGAGKSSTAGAAFRELGADYYNPDEASRKLRAMDPILSASEANSLAWTDGVRQLKRAIAERKDFAFETTLGGNTIPDILADAASEGIEIHVWYTGLSSPELHIERVKARVQMGGHDIPEADIRRRYKRSRNNLMKLLPSITVLRVYDNSADADPVAGKEPSPKLVLHIERGKTLKSRARRTPKWAKSIVAAALKVCLA